MELRRRGENELNRRIDRLTELVVELDKKSDSNGDNRDNSKGMSRQRFETPSLYNGDDGICGNLAVDYDNDCAP